MGGPTEPPEGGPEGNAGGEDEFRSVVFDESFIRAARIQELSASERLSGGQRAVRRRSGRGGGNGEGSSHHGHGGGGLPRQALALMLLIGFAFATAVYMGVRHPYPTPVSGVAANLSVQIIPLQPGPNGIPTGRATLPAGPVGSSGASGTPSSAASGAKASGSSQPSTKPTGSAKPSASGSGGASASASPSGGDTTGPFAGLPGSQFLAVGDQGFNLPNARHTDHFTHDQVLAALTTVQDYLKASSLDPEVLSGQDTDAVRLWISPGQYPQFDQSVSHPVDDQRHEATGWMVRFDPATTQLATQEVLVGPGQISYSELDAQTLQVTSDYTFLYALTPKQSAAASPAAAPSSTPAASGSAAASASGGAKAEAPQVQPVVYYAVRRSLTYWLTPDDIMSRRVQLVDSVVQAGATSCDADQSAYLEPLFPQQHASGSAAKGSGSATPRPSGPSASPSPTGIDPFDHQSNAWTVCGTLQGTM
ncbi:SCO2583 family membrane protein [Streptacidiphilus fuscans]|uniref:Uncharacterized protein n=1 Tax=Streptacidiphilus fuscans TaxID=2789292 RepID=A0A931B4U3_9ACTN|nr:hypothetical protein [Streptacidiphilus fuscans]MBF9070344.1 hypothetical protein [Streptacidiphilus fuscans]